MGALLRHDKLDGKPPAGSRWRDRRRAIKHVHAADLPSRPVQGPVETADLEC